MRNTWTLQIAGIECKGFAAFAAGIPLDQNPYSGGPRNPNAGGSLQRQRRQAWARGWELAQTEASAAQQAYYSKLVAKL